MKPSIYLVADNLPGKLFIMPKPSGEWLREDTQYYRTIGVDVIVSLLEQHEASELSLDGHNAICNDLGLEYIQFPIADRGLPNRLSFLELVQQIVQKLKRDQNVAVHCRAGIGRSGLVVCSALIGFGYTADEALEMTSDARGVGVPDTPAQREFVKFIGDEIESPH